MALFGRRSEPAPLDGVDVVLADLDGVVYAGAGALPHAVESLNRARDGRALAYITNNASRTDASVAGHLRSWAAHRPGGSRDEPSGGDAPAGERVAPGSTMLVVGGDGLVDEVEKAGFVVTRSAEDSPAAVVQGFAPEVGWTQLAEAAFALKVPEEEGGIPWIATNTDWTIPQSRGVAPGNGTLVSAVHTAIGRLATSPASRRCRSSRRPSHGSGRGIRSFSATVSTPTSSARTGRIPSALVLTGIDRPKHVLAAPAGSQPTFILGDLRELHEPYPEVSPRGRRRQVRGAKVAIDGPDVRIVVRGRPPDRPAARRSRGDLGDRPGDLRLPRPEAALRGPVPPALSSRPRRDPVSWEHGHDAAARRDRDDLLSPLDVIEAQPLATRAEAYDALHDTLARRLEVRPAGAARGAMTSRLDAALAARGLARSRTHAAHADRRWPGHRRRPTGREGVHAGRRRRGARGRRADHYVSRAAHKLIAGLDAFEVDVRGRLALDMGASTGGFTQVLPRAGRRPRHRRRCRPRTARGMPSPQIPG